MRALNHAIIGWALFLALCFTPPPAAYKPILPWCQPGFLVCKMVRS